MCIRVHEDRMWCETCVLCNEANEKVDLSEVDDHELLDVVVNTSYKPNNMMC